MSTALDRISEDNSVVRVILPLVDEVIHSDFVH